ncbi:MAG: TlpA family protein disulfide reductase, partial [Gammaproteobacteria bacterium]|nr:TlpA family protein disulfide reductase [Gammaproteobacteria bacterium]
MAEDEAGLQMIKAFSTGMGRGLLGWVCLFFSLNAPAYQQTDIELDSGSAISTAVYKGDGQHLLLWLPSERGMRGDYQPVAMDLAALGLDVWALDLHKSYMVPESRSSMDEFDREDLLLILEYAKAEGFAGLTFMADGRGAVLALEAARLWQQAHPDSPFLKGYVFVTPHLLVSSPEAGEAAQYKSIASETILPVYLIQPEYSTKYARSQEIAEVLGTGGSQVFTHLLKGVAGGFYMRPEADLNALDLQAKADLPETVLRAMSLMKTAKIPARKHDSTLVVESDTPEQPVFEGQTLKPFGGEPEPAPLQLQALSGQEKRLEDYRGKVVLLNFWASWCGPCAKEIPSLSRLVEKLKDRPFEVVTVNIGEDESHIKAFIKDLPVNFEILLDRDGQAVRDWNVYAYPSNFLIDKTG